MYGDAGFELTEDKTMFTCGEIDLTEKEIAEYKKAKKKYDKWQQRFYESFYDKQAEKRAATANIIQQI